MNKTITKIIPTGILAALLLSNTAFAFNSGDGSGILALLIFVYGGPAVLILCIILMVTMGFKKSLKIVFGIITGFIFILFMLIALASSGIDVI